MADRPKIPPKFLRELWKQIPKMKDCKGRCDSSCGPLPIPEDSVERELVEQRAGKRLETVGAGCDCSMLKNGLCTVYSIRPVLCRLWGTTPSMRCPHGCEPEFWLTDAEGFELLGLALGEDTDFRAAIEAMRPEDIEMFHRFIRQGNDLAERSPLFQGGVVPTTPISIVEDR